MNTRVELHEILCEVLGSRNVYYQPPESIKLNYPAIVYSRNRIDTVFADNSVYRNKRTYTVTVIDSNPESEIVEKMLELPMCRFDRHFTSDNLNHDTFTIYH